MFTTGWGFRMKWINLVQAAMAWKTVKLFRLTRNAVANSLGDGTRSVTLGDLPPEVCILLEESLTTSTLSDISRKAPFSLRFRDCCNAIADTFWREMRRKYEEHTAAQDDWYITRGGYFNSPAFALFQDTPEYLSLITEPWWTAHTSSIACENKIARDELFRCIRLQIPPEEALASMFMGPLLASVQEDLRIFAIDHNIQILTIINASEDREYAQEAVILSQASMSTRHNIRPIRAIRQQRIATPPRPRLPAYLRLPCWGYVKYATKQRNANRRSRRKYRLEPVGKLKWMILESTAESQHVHTLTSETVNYHC